MTKRIQAKHKVDRRLGVNLWGRPKSPFNTRAFGPGQHGQTRARGKPSDYKIQLQAKQKLKGYYLSLIHTPDPTNLGMFSYAFFCLKKQKLWHYTQPRFSAHLWAPYTPTPIHIPHRHD